MATKTETETINYRHVIRHVSASDLCVPCGRPAGPPYDHGCGACGTMDYFWVRDETARRAAAAKGGK